MTAAVRFVAVGVAASAALAAGVALWEAGRFGTSAAATAIRVERDVRATIDERVRELDRLATLVAAEHGLVSRSAQEPSHLARLFEQLGGLAATGDDHRTSATVYVAAPSGAGYRVLAWSDGPAESSLPPSRLAGPAALFVAPGSAGLRLIRVEPIVSAGVRVGVAAAETVLAPVEQGGRLLARRLATPLGRVTLLSQ